MKVLLLLVFLAAPCAAPAQSLAVSPQSSPDIEVIKYSWSKERVGWEKDPFGGPIENFDEMRVRARNEKRIMDAKRSGSGVDTNKAERDAQTDAALTSHIHKAPVARYGFVYKAEVRNNNAKPTKLIDWDYVFFDPQTEEELGRRQFTSEEKISPGKSKELKFFIPNPPTQTVSVNALQKNERAGLGEKIVIVHIVYADGSEWPRL